MEIQPMGWPTTSMWTEYLEIVQHLSIAIRDNYNVTAYDGADEYNHNNLVEFLKNYRHK